MYIENDLAHTIVNTYVDLVVSPFEVVDPESDEIAEKTYQFMERVNLEHKVREWARDICTYGFGVQEIQTDSADFISGEMIDLIRLNSENIFIDRRTPDGELRWFLQKAGFAVVGNIGPYTRQLDPTTCLYVAWDPIISSYGVSRLEPIKERLEQRDNLLDASVEAADKFADPLWHLTNNIPDKMNMDQDDVDASLDLMDKATDKVEAGSNWLITAGVGEYQATPLGPTSLPNGVPLLSHLEAACFNAAGLNPGAFMPTGGTANQIAQTQCLNNLKSLQRAIQAELNDKLFRLLPFLEDFPDVGENGIRVTMREPQIQEQHLIEQMRTTKINNELLLGKSGLKSENEVAKAAADKSTPDDPERYKEYMEGPDVQANPNDPNIPQAERKRIKIMGEGKDPGNNPLGTKGE